MDYNYEALDDQRFQKLSQALLVAQYPNTQCLPVGQPDGGRDAHLFLNEVNRSNFVVFQVKFSLDPKSRTERDVIEALIKSEQKKVQNLIRSGATRYHLVTNVQGTSHPDVGSIDKTNKALSDAFGIPAQVWWRDDLDRRLDNAGDIKWSYPEILKGTDVLPLLIQNSAHQRTARALKSYMIAQYGIDKDVKFKQVELQHKLTDLFVDLPLGHKQQWIEQIDDDDDEPSDELSDYINQLAYPEFEEESQFDHSGLAGAFLLQMPMQQGVSRLVVEGAPGQGKSTVTQFLCQVNRLRLLRKDYELRAVDDSHKTTLVRVPFRIDLRDYAAWVSGRDPFASTSEPTVLQQESKSLERFLARQVEVYSGGLAITADELLQFFEISHSVIVLDGFDEVADITTRERVVNEICEAAERLGAHAKSMQIIVTSRPAVFANSPGFPEDDWVHFELKDLRRANIEAYKDKWIEAQRLSREEGALVSSTLNDKLEQPHLRDLARNPMQLAILLHLIHVQGVALPEKRTTLYEEYMKLFFNREAEKSTIVRDHRNLLLSIHGLLAWVLHTQAEAGEGSGSMTKTDLYTEVRTYLETEGHDPQLAEKLFKGTVERVGALVSRVQDMFEFEVQPLREYFAAYHLYKTAPYSPPGQARTGTRPARFQAISRSSYWTNVTRFFCGFYDVGELPSLMDEITVLGEQNGYILINHPRRLAMMLLSDQVFSQSPRTMRRLIAFVAEEPGFRRLTSAVAPQRGRDMSLPAKAGGDALFEACVEKWKVEDNPSRLKVLREVMAENADRQRLKLLWTSRFNDGSMRDDPLREAMALGIAADFTPQEIARLVKEDVDSHMRWLILAHHYETITEDPSLYETAKKAFFDGALEFPLRWRHSADSVTALEALTDLLRPAVTNASATIVGRSHNPKTRLLIERVKQQYNDGVTDSLESFALFVANHLSDDGDKWQRSLAPWATLVDRGLDQAPSSYLMLRTASIATTSKAEADAGTWDEDGFAATKGLVHRLFFARHKERDADWWRARLVDITADTASQCLAILLSWGAPDVIAALKTEIALAIEGLSSRDWSRLWFMTNRISWAARRRRVGLPADWFREAGTLSPRMALLLLARRADQKAVRLMSRDYFMDYEGDDVQILRYAVQSELFRQGKGSVDWDYVRRLSKRAHQTGVHPLFPSPDMPPLKVPKAVAEAVLSDCENYDEQLVAICERAYAADVAQTALTVLQVAKTDGWFTHFD